MADRKPSGPLGKRLMVLLFTVLVTLNGGAAASLNDLFKVHGLDTVRAGEMAFLTCFLEGSHTGSVTRPPTYVWVKDGKVIPGQTDIFIRFNSLSREDAGLYQCGAPGFDVGGEGRHLHVVVPGDILPRPIVDYIDVPVCGRPFSLHCLFMERYIPSADTVYTWYKDHTVIKSQTGPRLSFPNVKEADGGEYVCTGREGPVNTTSPPSKEYHMIPLVHPQITIEMPSRDSVARGILGQTLTLTSKVIRAMPGVPYDGYSWSYLPSPIGQLRPLVGNTSTLTLGPVTREDSGQYFCQARNDRGFEDLNLIGNASVTVEVVYLENLTMSRYFKVTEGDPVTLTCRVDSHPTAKLAWTVNGQEVRHVIDNLDHYVILSAACSDSNNYTCAASNPDLPGPEINATVQLTVLCKEVTTMSYTKESHTKVLDLGAALVTMERDKEIWKTAAIILIGFYAFLIAVFILCTWRACRWQRKHRKNDCSLCKAETRGFKDCHFGLKKLDFDSSPRKEDQVDSTCHYQEVESHSLVDCRSEDSRPCCTTEEELLHPVADRKPEPPQPLANGISTRIGYPHWLQNHPTRPSSGPNLVKEELSVACHPNSPFYGKETN